MIRHPQLAFPSPFMTSLVRRDRDQAGVGRSKNHSLQRCASQRERRVHVECSGRPEAENSSSVGSARPSTSLRTVFGMTVPSAREQQRERNRECLQPLHWAVVSTLEADFALCQLHRVICASKCGKQELRRKPIQSRAWKVL
jgi:hypothetical protein